LFFSRKSPIMFLHFWFLLLHFSFIFDSLPSSCSPLSKFLFRFDIRSYSTMACWKLFDCLVLGLMCTNLVVVLLKPLVFNMLVSLLSSSMVELPSSFYHQIMMHCLLIEDCFDIPLDWDNFLVPFFFFSCSWEFCLWLVLVAFYFDWLPSVFIPGSCVTFFGHVPHIVGDFGSLVLEWLFGSPFTGCIWLLSQLNIGGHLFLYLLEPWSCCFMVPLVWSLFNIWHPSIVDLGPSLPFLFFWISSLLLDILALSCLVLLFMMVKPCW